MFFKSQLNGYKRTNLISLQSETRKESQSLQTVVEIMIKFLLSAVKNLLIDSADCTFVYLWRFGKVKSETVSTIELLFRRPPWNFTTKLQIMLFSPKINRIFLYPEETLLNSVKYVQS